MVIAIDIGGTHIRIAEVKNSRINKKKVIDTPKSKDEILGSILSLLKSYTNKKVICISIAGFVRNNKIVSTPNLDLSDFDLKKWLEKKFKSKVYIENDAKCVALSEIKYGSGKKFKNFIVIVIGTGIGGALVINKKLYRGSGYAGEFGHMTLDGTEFEKVASGTALNQLAKESNLLAKGEEIAELAENGHALPKRIFEIITENLSDGLLNLVYAFDPDAIIIGGAFSKIRFLPTKLSISIKDHDLIKRDTVILNSYFRDNSELIGASLLPKGS